MNARPDEQALSPALQRNARAQILNDVWLLTIVAVIVGTAVPWLANNFQIRMAGASLGLLGLGATHVAQTLLGAPLRTAAAWRLKAVTALEIVGVVLLGFIWDQVGALQNPLFLVIFILPILGAIFLARGLTYWLAALSIVIVGFVALREAPELRWFASGLVGNDTWLTALFGRDAATPDPAFSGFSAPLNYLIVLLEVFSIGLIACAVAAEYVGILFVRLDLNTAIARGEAQRGEELWASLIEHLPLPALLIDLTSANLIAASDSATAYLRIGAGTLEGRNLYEVLKLSYPETLQALIAGEDGDAPAVVIRIEDDVRLTRMRVLHAMHKERRLALLTIEDRTELYCLRATLDTSEYAAVVIDAKGRVMAFNKPLAGLLGQVELGMDATRLLSESERSERWWEPGLTGRRKMHVQIGTRIYQLTASATSLPGEEASIYMVSLLPVAGGTQADTEAASSTIITGTLRQLR